MSEKSLSYFMREEAKTELVVTVPGLDSIRDENGNVIPFEIKKLSNKRMDEINKLYIDKQIMKDKKGNILVQNGQVVMKVDKDYQKSTRHMMVEALVYPNLRDKSLMDFFGCVDITDMPFKVFPSNDEYTYVQRKVMEVLNLIEPEDNAKQELEDAKN